MSRREPKAREWLTQQIDELGALRNASVRDPQFKAWRQNTLTFIQRIWPGDSSKSERFRRVPFTPPSTRHDAKMGREHFERGCGEALEYLNSLLALLDQDVETGGPQTIERPAESFEGDFPTVSLGGDMAEVGAAPPAEIDERFVEELQTEAPAGPPARSTGPPELPSSAGRPAVPGSSGDFLDSAAFLDPEAESPGNLPSGPAIRPVHKPAKPVEVFDESRSSDAGRAEAGPLEPRPVESGPRPLADTPPGNANNSGRISVRGAPQRSSAPAQPVNPLRDILETERPEATRPESPAPAAPPARPLKNGKKTKKPRLKDMLGLSSLEHDADLAARAAPQPIEPARFAGTPIEPSPVAETPVEEVTPPPSPAVEAPWPATAGPLAPAGERLVDWSMPEFMTPPELPLPLTSADVVPELPAAPEPEVGARGPEAADEDDGHTARMTAEFLSNSLVLSSTPRPVQRRGAVGTPASVQPIPTRDSAASRLLAIAAEVDSLGVPEGHRARARAALMDLARQLDGQDVAWDVLREAIHFMMEFPPLARRTLPLLLPFLDLAA